MKHILFLFLLLPALAFGQQIVRDTAYLKDTTIAGMRYYQEVRVIAYDNGQSSTQTGPRLDSAEFVRRAFRDAHDAMLPVAEGVRLLTLAGDNRRTHQYYSGILQAVTGQNYRDGVLEGGKFTNYIRNYRAVWRVFYDSLGTQRDFYVFYNDTLNVGREITNPAAVIAGGAPVYVPSNRDRRIRFFPYETFFAQVTVLVRNAQNALTPLFAPLPEVRESLSIVDDTGADTGRRLWLSVNRTGLTPPARLVKIPITAQPSEP